MSKSNGDRSRSHVQARHKIKMREKNRELRAALQTKTPTAKAKPKG
jgi:hypothetical protein